MKKFSAFIGISLLFLFGACTHNEPIVVTDDTVLQQNATSISLFDALKRLDQQLYATEVNSTTRSSVRTYNPNTSQIVYLSDITPTTRGNASTDKALAYIVPFNEGGFALLGADPRAASVILLSNANEEVLTTQSLATAYQDLISGADQSNQEYLYGLTAQYLVKVGNSEPNSAIINPPIVSEWILLEHQPTLMYTQWSQQSSPFTKYCKDQYGNTCPAGCIPIAFAQILAYNSCWNDKRFDGIQAPSGEVYYPNWDLINQAASGTYGVPVWSTHPKDIQEELALFVYHIGKALYVRYDPCGSGVYTDEVAYFLSGESDFVPLNSAYKNIQSLHETSNPITGNKLIQEAIRENVFVNHRPIMMSGSTSQLSSSAHAWVVDGWQLWVDKSMQTITGLYPIQEIKLYCNFGNSSIGCNYLCDYGLFTEDSGKTTYVRDFTVTSYTF